MRTPSPDIVRASLTGRAFCWKGSHPRGLPEIWGCFQVLGHSMKCLPITSISM